MPCASNPVKRHPCSGTGTSLHSTQISSEARGTTSFKKHSSAAGSRHNNECKAERGVSLGITARS